VGWDAAQKLAGSSDQLATGALAYKKSFWPNIYLVRTHALPIGLEGANSPMNKAKPNSTGQIWRQASLVPLLFIALSGAWAEDSGASDQTTADLTEMTLEDLMKVKVETVYGASKFLQKVTEAPASVTIVTSEEIREYGYRTLADVLRNVRGFYVTYDRNYNYVGVRGFGRPGDYNTRILLLVDGHRVNDNIYEQAFVGTDFPVDIDLIDRIEVIRGPSSSVYGSNAFFAVVNLITRRGQSLKGLEVSGNLSSFDTVEGRLSYGRRFRHGGEMLLSGTLYDSHGPAQLYFMEFDSPATNHGIAQDADGDRFGQLFGTISYRDFTLQGVYGSREKGIPTASWDTVFNDPRTRTTDNRGYLDLKYDHTFGNQVEVEAHVTYDQYDYFGIYVDDNSQTDTPLIVLNKDYAFGKWWGAEAKLGKTLQKHKLSVGAEYRDNFRQVQGDYDVNPYYLYLDDRRHSNVAAAYVEDEFRIRKNLLLNAGLRCDHYSVFGGTTNPRLGLVYSPLEKTSVKLLYGTAFRAPTAYELFYAATPSIANPALKPESVKTAEIVAEQDLWNHFRFSAGAFYNRINRLINEETLPDGSLQYQNSGSALAKGLEGELERKWTHGIETGMSYSFQQAYDRQTGSALVDSPRHLANLNVLVPLASRKILAGLNVQYVSAMKTLEGGTAAGFVVPNVTITTQRMFKGIVLSASLDNVSGTRYGYSGGNEHVEDIIYQDGRTFRLKLTYTFHSRREAGK
jgi:outer membrane receptor for ferrienterochelin and colicins